MLMRVMTIVNDDTYEDHDDGDDDHDHDHNDDHDDDAVLPQVLLLCPGQQVAPYWEDGIVKRWNLTLEQCLRLYFIFGIGVLCCVCIFFIQCDNPPFAGVNVFEM